MPDLDLIRKLAFSFLKKADAELLRTLIDKGISAEQFFTMETAELAHALRLSQGNRFEKMERDEAETLIRRKDRTRETYYNYFTFGSWGAADSYDLCIDSSILGIEGTAEAIVDFGKKAGRIAHA